MGFRARQGDTGSLCTQYQSVERRSLHRSRASARDPFFQLEDFWRKTRHHGCCPHDARSVWVASSTAHGREALAHVACHIHLTPPTEGRQLHRAWRNEMLKSFGSRNGYSKESAIAAPARALSGGR